MIKEKRFLNKFIRKSFWKDKLSFLENPIAINRVIEKIVADIRLAKKSLKIYAGEAHCMIFDDPRFLNALREFKKNGGEIQIVVGPVISRGGSRTSPEIISLSKEGVVKLYCRSKRDRTSHFRIIDDIIVEVESMHYPLLPYDQRLRRKTERFSKGRSPFVSYYVKLFEDYTKEENLYSSSGERKCIFLRSFEIRGVIDLAGQQGKDYDELTKEEIFSLLKQFKRKKNKKD